MYDRVREHLAAELAGIEAAGLYKHERQITTPQGSHVGVLDDGDPDGGPVIDVQGQFSVALEELRSLRARRLPDAMA